MALVPGINVQCLIWVCLLEQGLEQLIEAIQEVSKDFKKVLIVTHLDQLKAAFPVQIEVAKLPDVGSRFAVTQHA